MKLTCHSILRLWLLKCGLVQGWGLLRRLLLLRWRGALQLLGDTSTGERAAGIKNSREATNFLWLFTLPVDVQNLMADGWKRGRDHVESCPHQQTHERKEEPVSLVL